MKTILAIAAVVAALTAPAFAGSKVLPECDSPQVEQVVLRTSGRNPIGISTILRITDARSPDPTEVRICRAEAILNTGRMWESIWEIRWTSETDGRWWLQSLGGRFL